MQDRGQVDEGVLALPDRGRQADRARQDARRLHDRDARAAADKEFTMLAPEWPAHRQPAVDRAILRLAHYELTLGRTPAKLVLSEAIELARHFSTDKSPAFVNGLLDKVYRRIHPEG
jgi:transcription termination factor NusB